MNTQDPDYFIDVSGDVCPMTFVKTKLAYERAKLGQIIEIRLRGEEPIENVPRALAEAGAIEISRRSDAEGGLILRVQKANAAK
ncbi:MAG: sulfurtransferase TusA family protein [Pseudomonadota bacterium]